MDDKQIVDLFWSRNEAAITASGEKYGKYCHCIAYGILNNEEDAKEIVNDTYLKAWNTIPPQKPTSLKSYLGMIVRQLSTNRIERITAEKRGHGQLPLVLDELSECISDGREDSAIDPKALGDALNKFLYSLPKKTRNIFIRRYWYVSPITDIAADYGMKENTVTVLILRTRKKLKDFLLKEGFEI